MDLSSFFHLLSIIGVLFLLMATGFICRRTGVIDELSSKRFSGLIIKVGQPMMIIGALIEKEFDVALLREGALYLLLGFLLHPLMALVAFLTGGLYREENERKISQFATIFTNCGFIGFPILEAVFPGKGSFNGAFFLIGFHVYIWTLGMLILGRGREDIRLTPKKALLNYGTVPCAIGLSLYLLKAVLPIPTFLVDFANYLGNLCLPIAVLITGALLATQPIGAMLKNKKLYLFNAIKLLGVPLLVCALAKLATLTVADGSTIVLFCTVIAALPSATTITMLSELYDLDSAYAAQAVGSSSVLSVATLPLMYFIADLVARL